jgi:hypothetical protein
MFVPAYCHSLRRRVRNCLNTLSGRRELWIG